jgi:hypothetical protein
MKKALLCGINYTGTQHALRGCVNDIIAINEILVNNLGFTDPKYIRMLTDDSATTQNILERLEWLVDDAQPGDVLYFHYSGHGAQMPIMDYNKMDEPDGMDEVIVPIDMNWRDKIIKDNDFKRIFGKVPKDVNLTVTLDCCHSGDGLRDFLPPIEMRDDLLGPTRTRAISAPIDIMNRAYGLELQPKERALQIRNIEDQSGLLISGCKSDQTSADAWIQQANKFYGALTYCMVQLLKQNNFQLSYRQMVETLNVILCQSGFSQRPELNGKAELFEKLFLQPYV